MHWIYFYKLRYCSYEQGFIWHKKRSINSFFPIVLFEIWLCNTSITQKQGLSWVVTLNIVIFSWAKGYFMEDFFLLYWIMKKFQKAKRIHHPFLLLQQKRLGEVKNEQVLDLLIHSMIVKTQVYWHTFFKFPSLPSDNNCWCNLTNRQNNKDGFNVCSKTVLCHHHFQEKVIKSHFRNRS